MQPIIPELSDNGEQDWGVPRPSRTGLPEQLPAASIHQRAQFCAVLLDGCGNASVRDGVMIADGYLLPGSNETSEVI
jgi:hypothetical protein